MNPYNHSWYRHEVLAYKKVMSKKKENEIKREERKLKLEQIEENIKNKNK